MPRPVFARWRSPLSAALVALVVAGGPVGVRVAHAQSRAPKSDASGTSDRQAAGRAAKAQYDEGERAFKKGDFRRAAELFENAYRIFPHHSALWAAARAWIRAGEDVRGANLLERYLREAPPNAPDRDRATEVITDLDKRLGRVEVLLNDVTDVRIDGEPLDGDKIWVVPGEHVASADAHGKPVRKTVSVAAGDRVSVTLELPPPVVVPPSVENRPPRPLPPWLIIVGGGLTVAGAGVLTYSGIDTINKKNDFQEYVSGLGSGAPGFTRDAAQSKLDEANRAQDRTNILIGVTVGVAVVTTVAALFFTDWGGKATVKTASLGPGRRKEEPPSRARSLPPALEGHF